ncbi:MAG: DUF4276 family protein [Acidobacteria bacterium]|nr:DUF4276 family protein [Acidobacteriota bacterium]
MTGGNNWPMSVRIAAIVEGHGEVEALPLLLRRIAAVEAPEMAVDILQPIRQPRDSLLKLGELEKWVRKAVNLMEGTGAIVVVLDSERDCPAQLGPSLDRRIRAACTEHRTLVALAHREFECWFLAAARSLAGVRGLPQDLQRPDDPESVQGAKEWIIRRRGSYSPTVDQPKLTALFDLDEAMSAPSFRRFYRRFADLLAQLRDADGAGHPA